MKKDSATADPHPTQHTWRNEETDRATEDLKKTSWAVHSGDPDQTRQGAITRLPPLTTTDRSNHICFHLHHDIAVGNYYWISTAFTYYLHNTASIEVHRVKWSKNLWFSKSLVRCSVVPVVKETSSSISEITSILPPTFKLKDLLLHKFSAKLNQVCGPGSWHDKFSRAENEKEKETSILFYTIHQSDPYNIKGQGSCPARRGAETASRKWQREKDKEHLWASDSNATAAELKLLIKQTMFAHGRYHSKTFKNHQIFCFQLSVFHNFEKANYKLPWSTICIIRHSSLRYSRAPYSCHGSIAR